MEEWRRAIPPHARIFAEQIHDRLLEYHSGELTPPELVRALRRGPDSLIFVRPLEDGEVLNEEEDICAIRRRKGHLSVYNRVVLDDGQVMLWGASFDRVSLGMVPRTVLKDEEQKVPKRDFAYHARDVTGGFLADVFLRHVLLEETITQITG